MSQNKYDLIYILDPNSTSEEAAAVAAKVEQITSAASGSVVKKEELGRRRLAYHIGRHREGLYTYFLVQVDTKTIEEITRNLRLVEKVIKYQVVKEEVSHRKVKPPRKRTPRPAGSEGTSRPSFRPAPRPTSPVTPDAAPPADAPSA
jgi:small subunit ribosomal protein S6